MEHIGWLSVVPPVVAIALAIYTKQVFLSLGLFVWLGWTILSSWNPLLGLVKSVDVLVEQIGKPDNTRVLMFSALIGSLITVTQRSGGMQGFVNWMVKRGTMVSARGVALFPTVVSMFLFLESNFSLLVSGSVARPMFDRFRVSREKLSYIIDATCSPKMLLVGSLLPVNAWGAYVFGLLAAQGVESPAGVLMSSAWLNFYAILALGMVFWVAITDWNIGPMVEAERRVRETGELLRPGATPMVSADVATTEPKDGVPARAANMVVPIVVMVFTVLIAMWITGDGKIREGSGSTSVLWGVIAGVGVAVLANKVQGIMTFEESTESVLRGIQGLVPLVLVLLLAFAISATITALGTGVYVAQAAEAALPAWVVPAVIFLLSSFMAFSTGTSWGTFAIMIPIVVPMIEIIGLHPGLAIGAALGGGIFGDHSSPISDSTIVASMASATDHIDHVRTQLPYALIAGAGSVVLFLVFGAIL